MRTQSCSILGFAILAGVTHAQYTERASVDSAGAQVNSESVFPSISADGRLVAFASIGAFVPGDTNGRVDVFLRDRPNAQTTRISVATSGAQGDGESSQASMSADGRFIAFASWATNFASSDTNGRPDIFLRDRVNNSTACMSVASSGVQGNLESGSPSLSADGRFVAFDSYSTNLVATDTNFSYDIFVHDSQSGQTRRVSVDSAGVQANDDSFEPSISGDGRFVAFYSTATNLVAGDTNGSSDIFVHDAQTGATTRVNVDSSGAQAASLSLSSAAWISTDGRWVAFWSNAANLVAGDTNAWADVFVHDRHSGATTLESLGPGLVQGNGPSFVPALSRDGRFVTFYSRASNLVPGGTNLSSHIFLRDRWIGATTCSSLSTSGALANGDSFHPVVSQDGRVVVFYSSASLLVPGDTNGVNDVFVRDSQASNAFAYCTAKLNSLGCTPTISAAGVPSPSSGDVFVVVGHNELNSKPGVLLYSASGRIATPFQGGFACVAVAERTPPVNSGGSPPPIVDCSGVLSIDMNAFASGALGGNPQAYLSGIGQTVNCQWWSRDPGIPAPNSTALTGGLEYVVAP